MKSELSYDADNVSLSLKAGPSFLHGSLLATLVTTLPTQAWKQRLQVANDATVTCLLKLFLPVISFFLSVISRLRWPLVPEEFRNHVVIKEGVVQDANHDAEEAHEDALNTSNVRQ